MSIGINNIDELLEKIDNELKEKKSSTFKIKVVANSKNDSLEFEAEFIKVKIKQRAIEGKANKAIIEFLSDILKFSKSRIEILNGHKSAIKTIKIT